MSKQCSRMDYLAKGVTKGMSSEGAKLWRDNFEHFMSLVADEDLRTGDDFAFQSITEAMDEKSADARVIFDSMVAEVNADKPMAPHPKNKKKLVPIVVHSIEGKTAFVSYGKNTKVYPLENFLKQVSLDAKDIQEVAKRYPAEMEVTRQQLKEGDSIKLFSQVNIDGGHVTLEFNPEGVNSKGPSLPEGVTEGMEIEVIKVGEYKDNNMEYDVIELKLGDSRLLRQPTGTPYHITRFVNGANGIKPFMTGQHAKEGTYTKVKEKSLGKGTVEFVRGTYNPLFDKGLSKEQLDTIKKTKKECK